MNPSAYVSAYILIVDDDADARELLARIVATLNITTETAKDGIEALDLINTKPPILILLDIMMPRMDGFAVLNRLLGKPHTRYIPVIIITACDRQQAKLLESLRVKGIVRKGEFTPESLVATIRSSIKPSPQLKTPPIADPSVKGTHL